MSHNPNGTQQERIYHLLEDIKLGTHTVPEEYLRHDAEGKWVSARYIKQVMFISECNGRISELRAMGHDIRTAEVKDDHGFAYHRLTGETLPPQPKQRSGKPSGPKVTYMGKEVEFEALPDAGLHSLDDAFAAVKLSPAAIDRASQIVPEKHWLSEGVYSWLERRANEAFKKMPVSAKEFTWGRLRYMFEYTDEGPQLKMVTLIG